MKKATYNNMLKATKMISEKGYDWNTSNELAIRCFEQSKQNGMSVEWHINRIVTKAEHETYS